MSSDKDPGHVIGGFKAAITNPNTSAEAKEHAAERLQELGEPDYTSSLPDPVQQELGTHQIAGYKATISNPKTSEEAKERARDVLEAEGEEVPRPPKQHSPPPSPQHDEHTKRVLAGYKATLRNPKVSEEAKERARDYLKNHGEEV